MEALNHLPRPERQAVHLRHDVLRSVMSTLMILFVWMQDIPGHGGLEPRLLPIQGVCVTRLYSILLSPCLEY